ncbi:hypothetical protein KCP73_15410 [Salmonella enterica subsp. enterica]|nr:hypothetical protein KCP73_15410 [Salmonella enterica subsp. enterica]
MNLLKLKGFIERLLLAERQKVRDPFTIRAARQTLFDLAFFKNLAFYAVFAAEQY